MLKMYGTPLCPDCVEVEAALAAKKIPFENVDITASTANLKAFLKLRDENPLFDAVRAEGGIGVPCFALDDGRLTLDVREALL